MTVSPFDSALFGYLFADKEIAALFDDRAQISAMLRVEAALAMAQAKAGVIPQKEAASIADICCGFAPDPASLALDTARAGVPVSALVKALKREIGGNNAQFVHFGVTSQDVFDTALVLRLRDAMGIVRRRMRQVATLLQNLADKHRKTVMVGRTRSQQAVPTTFGLKAAGWLSPLVRRERRIESLGRDLFRLSLGGAAGTLASLGENAPAVESILAAELDLEVSDMPWHAQRDVLVDFAAQLTVLTGALGKMGQDIVLLAQSEVGEVQPERGGGSSTMVHKSNPVQAEMLVTLARFNAGQIGTVAQAQIHDHERCGSSWLLEWAVLPPMVMATSTALMHAADLLSHLRINECRMAENLDTSRGALLAEAASFALAEHVGRDQADDIVRQAVAHSLSSRRDLFDELPTLTDAPVKWENVRDPLTYIGQVEMYIERVLAAARCAFCQ